MPGIAIFDLDRTMTIRGCFTPFILYVAKKHPRRFLSVPQIAVAAAASSFGFCQRDEVKLLMWRKVIGGLPRGEIESLGADFGQLWAQNHLRRQTRASIKKHRDAGDRLILATAAMDIIAEAFGEALGFDEVICTRTDWNADNQVSGSFDGKNCYGEEKLRRVKLVLGDSAPPETFAYSDHITDLPLLIWAGSGVAVNPHRPLLDAAGRHGLRIEDWD